MKLGRKQSQPLIWDPAGVCVCTCVCFSSFLFAWVKQLLVLMGHSLLSLQFLILGLILNPSWCGFKVLTAQRRLVFSNMRVKLQLSSQKANPVYTLHARVQVYIWLAWDARLPSALLLRCHGSSTGVKPTLVTFAVNFTAAVFVKTTGLHLCEHGRAENP